MCRGSSCRVRGSVRRGRCGAKGKDERRTSPTRVDCRWVGIGQLGAVHGAVCTCRGARTGYTCPGKDLLDDSSVSNANALIPARLGVDPPQSVARTVGADQ